MQHSVETLLYLLLFMQSTAHQCDEGTAIDCVTFTQYLSRAGKVARAAVGPNYCHVLVKTPMTFYQASVTCINAGGRLSHVISTQQVNELFQQIHMDKVDLTADAGVWVTTCSNAHKATFKWANGREPPSAEIPNGAKLTLCSSHLCWNTQHANQRKLPFLCETGTPVNELTQDEFDRIKTGLETFIIVVSVIMCITLCCLWLFIGVFFHIAKRKVGDNTVEAAKARGLEDKQVQSTQGPQGGQPAPEGAQSAAVGGEGLPQE